MKIYAFLVPQFQQEIALTEKFLKRIPEDKMDWKPHDKSMSIQELANHLAEIPEWVAGTMDFEAWDLKDYQAPAKTSVNEILEDLRNNASMAEKALQKPDEVYRETWKMTEGETVLMEMPRFNVLQSIVMNQFPHHRAQLGVYFRLLDISVPATYGPSADEQ
ncbi:DinB family protein [Gramella sp. MAR_2010_147]|uniref:DinB family protein n=1 Tax=Gramella sp. MAR_2010_147 TaxID=1250205 RepID=UPI00087DCBBF|nr:DinB family protein [Gramella sp. MAR_2010_147]SDS66911.1 Uncharacterized damage-inducible protein DinB (forms a four-helix bundle) [Gramella sp. MAR_2010_147]